MANTHTLQPITGKEITTRRKALGLKMTEAARRANTPYNTWVGWEYEAGGRRPPGIVAALLEAWEKEKNQAKD